MQISDSALRAELSFYPEWLAEQVIQWVRQQEARGNEFTSASAAVWHAKYALA